MKLCHLHLPHRFEFEEDIKKSRFQAIAVPVENEQAVKDFLEANK